MRPLILLLLALLAIVASADTSVPVYSREYTGTLDVSILNRDVVFSETNGKYLIFPATITLQWQGSLTYVLEERVDPTTFRYRVDHVRAFFASEPPKRIVKNGYEILLTWFSNTNVDVSFDLGSPYTIVSVITFNVFVTAQITFDKLVEGRINVVDEIRNIIESDLHYIIEANVSRYEPEPAIFSVRADITLGGDGTLRIYRFSAENVSVDIKQYANLGDYDSKGYLLIAPEADIATSLCLYGPSDSPLSLMGELRYTDPFGEQHTAPAYVSVGCHSATIENVPVLPGNYTGNNTLTLQFVAAEFSATIPVKTVVSGAALWVGKPFAAIISNGSTNYFIASVGTQLYEYGMSTSGSVTISVPSIGRECSGTVIVNTTSVKCGWYVSEDFNETEVSVTATLMGTSASGSATVPVVHVGNTPFATMMTWFIKSFTTAGTVLVLVGSVLILAEHIMKMVFKKSMVYPVDPFRILGAGIILLIVVYAFPAIEATALTALATYTPAKAVLSAGPISNPEEVFGESPEEAVAELVTYYDLLFMTMKSDFVVWVSSPLSSDITVRLIGIGILVASLFVLAMVLMASMNAALPGQFMVPLISFAFSIMAVLVSMAPLIGAVVAFMNIVQAIMAITLVIAGVLLTVAVLLLIAPSSAMTALAEELLSASIGYMVIVPLIGPLSYAFYVLVRDAVSQQLSGLVNTVVSLKISLGLGVGALIPPIDIITLIMAYITFTTATLVLVVLAFIGPFITSGLFTGIGVAIMRAFRLR